jgi:hypothetical protein
MRVKRLDLWCTTGGVTRKNRLKSASAGGVP